MMSKLKIYEYYIFQIHIDLRKTGNYYRRQIFDSDCFYSKNIADSPEMNTPCCHDTTTCVIVLMLQ